MSEEPCLQTCCRCMERATSRTFLPRLMHAGHTRCLCGADGGALHGMGVPRLAARGPPPCATAGVAFWSAAIPIHMHSKHMQELLDFIRAPGARKYSCAWNVEWACMPGRRPTQTLHPSPPATLAMHLGHTGLIGIAELLTPPPPLLTHLRAPEFLCCSGHRAIPLGLIAIIPVHPRRRAR